MDILGLDFDKYRKWYRSKYYNFFVKLPDRHDYDNSKDPSVASLNSAYTKYRNAMLKELAELDRDFEELRRIEDMINKTEDYLEKIKVKPETSDRNYIGK